MVLKFEEYINEGLWSKGVDRSKTGEVRQEEKDKIFYKPNVYPVPDFKDWYFMFTYFGGNIRNKCVNIYLKPYEKYVCQYYGVKMKPNKRYMIIDRNNKGANYPNDKDFNLIYSTINSNKFIDAINNYMDTLPVSAFRIKKVEEGLWSKGVERSKTGEEREEDKLPEGQYRIKDFPDFGFILDLDENGDIYIDIVRLPIDDNDDPIYFISKPFIGKCPTFSKKYYEDNIHNNGNVNIHEIETIESEKFRKALNDTLKSLPEETWTNRYFAEDLEEGLWSKGIERSKTGEEREEKKIHSNIDELKGIDLGLPFLMSDDYLYINGEEKTSFIDYNEKYRNYVESKGWRLPNRDDIGKLKAFANPFKPQIIFDANGKNGVKTVYMTGEKTNETVNFNFKDGSIFMWCDYHYIDTEGSKKDPIGELWTCTHQEVERHNGNRNRPQLLRLIQDKNINEGLWKSGVKRSQTGELRQENKLVSNISEFNEVDLSSRIPFVFADKDLIINGNDEYFTWRDMMTIIDNVKDTGWRLPTMDDFKHYFMTDYKTPKKNVRFNIDKHLTEISVWFKSMFKSDDKKPKLIFNINPNHNKEGEDYWLGTSPMDDISDKFDKICFSVGDLDYKDITPFIIFGKNPTKQCKIRLVKDKNKINEGLWSKGVERSISGNKRQEDLKPFDRIIDWFSHVVSNRWGIEYNPKLLTYEIERETKTFIYYYCMLDISSFKGMDRFNFKFKVRKDELMNLNDVFEAFVNGFIDESFTIRKPDGNENDYLKFKDEELYLWKYLSKKMQNERKLDDNIELDINEKI